MFCKETYDKTVEETIAEYQEVDRETVYESTRMDQLEQQDDLSK